MMRWERVGVNGGGGPGKRWGHTCNAVQGGRFFYVFGGFGDDNRHTNKIHVFDTVNRIWSEPLTKGALPSPRDSHSCTTIGDKLFVFGGTNGRVPLNDLHIFDTSSNTWISPSLRGDRPNPREGHSAAFIGKRLFIFGGCGKFDDAEIFYDDVYVLNTETLVWKRIVPSGIPPSKRESHSCSSWNSKIIIIGGQDTSNYYQSDVHIFDADTLSWCKLNTTGQILPPRGGHTAVSLGKNIFIFGGFTDDQSLFDDVYMLDVGMLSAAGIWSEVIPTGEGPSARFAVAGDCLDPHIGGTLVFIGGCDKNLKALEDMHFLHTGLARGDERDERRLEKLSLRKQLKLKCQEQQALSSPYSNALTGFNSNANVHHQHTQPCRQNVYLNEYQTPLGKKTFQAKVTKNFPDGYTVETVIDGKCLRGILFSNKPRPNQTPCNDSIRNMGSGETDREKQNGDHDSVREVTRPSEANANDFQQADVSGGNSLRNEAPVEDATAETTHEVHGVPHDVNLESSMLTDAVDRGTKVSKENATATTDS
ncbi:kelch domain-containing protein 3 isoform X1 [Capsicum annuum]|uniref:kelch domain-containing protein 3 isoform X1 n=1 Tax=Capsicum annuum TaxID=4072 RepID=UPI001FB100CD|nr:kelch domain-containing protein 3 isoform X1 [Capsicum annuum]